MYTFYINNLLIKIGVKTMHGVETMAWVGDRPWHGLGVEITEDE